MVSMVSLVLWSFAIFALYLRFCMCLMHKYAPLLWCHVVMGFHGFASCLFLGISFYVLSLGNFLGKTKLMDLQEIFVVPNR